VEDLENWWKRAIQLSVTLGGPRGKVKLDAGCRQEMDKVGVVGKRLPFSLGAMKEVMRCSSDSTREVTNLEYSNGEELV
jgi:hypothetical protein